MPWREVSMMSERLEFIRLAMKEGANRRELCRRFHIHPDTGYKWISRFREGADLTDRSRRPHTSPGRTPSLIEAKVLKIRDDHPAWGARKIAGVLEREGTSPPALSTIHEILHRSERIIPKPGGACATQRFEKSAPNLLWQMDFKGWVRLEDGVRCHPLTIVDDHSRYVPCLKACGDQKQLTVQTHLTATFQRYGLPIAFFVDNGPPWGDSSGHHWTRLRVWLLKLGVEVIYSRPYHPQSRGKNERFHRTLKAEVFAFERFENIDRVQRAFDAWRPVYNYERPHEALGQSVPADRYRPSVRSMPCKLPSVEYDEGEIVRTVPTTKDYISFRGRFWKIPEAFRGERVAIRPRGCDGQFGVFFASHRIGTIDLTKPKSVGDVPEQVSVMSPD